MVKNLVNRLMDWKDYQEEAAAFFRELGLDASTDVPVKGVRTTHNVDVLVKSHFVGFDITWIVECKLWSSKVSKVHIIALREIVKDVGADRGILLSESGFQSGAFEAAHLTDVQLTTLCHCRKTSSEDVLLMRLREIYDRIDASRDHYWDITKKQRIDCGLRPDVGMPGYTGIQVIDVVDDLIKKAFRGTYPIEPVTMAKIQIPQLPTQFNSLGALVAAIEPVINQLEAILRACVCKRECAI